MKKEDDGQGMWHVRRKNKGKSTLLVGKTKEEKYSEGLSKMGG
jgi:hypothetical protein